MKKLFAAGALALVMVTLSGCSPIFIPLPIPVPEHDDAPQHGK